MIVECSVADLRKLCGKNLSKTEFEDILSMYGAPPEPTDEADLLRVEVFPNRPDMLSPEGISRALRGILKLETGLKEYSAKSSGITLKVDSSVEKVRPFISAALVEGVTLEDACTIESLMQLQEKLHLTHGRKRKKVAIGVHDTSKIGRELEYVAIPKENVKFVPLGMSDELSGPEILEKHPKGQEYGGIISDFENFPIVRDTAGTILSLPPIINGDATEVTPKSRELLIEVTGWDSAAVEQACTIVATALAERGGARIKTVKIIEGTDSRIHPLLSPREMKLDTAYIQRILGLNIPENEIGEYLEMMRFGVSGNGTVRVPAYRTDILHQIDLAEDVAIAFGYDKFEPSIPALPNVGRVEPSIEEKNMDRQTMIGLGFEEVFTFVLTSPQSLFVKMTCEKEREIARIGNPNSEEFTIVRDQIMPSLMQVLSSNTHNPYPQKVFECGEVVLLDSATDTKTRTLSRVCGMVADSTAGFTMIKQVVHAVLTDKGVWEDVTLEPSDHPWFVQGRQADILSGGRVIGSFGEVHPQVLENFGIEMPAAGFEIDTVIQ